MALFGRRYYPVGANFPAASFTVALLLTTVSVISIGFVIASVVPTARFAQPVAALVVYPMLAMSGAVSIRSMHCRRRRDSSPD